METSRIKSARFVADGRSAIIVIDSHPTFDIKVRSGELKNSDKLDLLSVQDMNHLAQLLGESGVHGVLAITRRKEVLAALQAYCDQRFEDDQVEVLDYMAV